MSSDKIQFYDMKYREGVCPSPFAAMVKFVLLRKGLEFDKIDLSLSKTGPTIKELTNDKWALIPTLKFPNGDVIYDSPEIIKYLEEHYPQNKLDKDRPDLEAILQKFTTHARTYFHMVLLPIYHCMGDESEKEYFRTTRETWFKCKLEDIKVSDEQVQAIIDSHADLESHLSKNNYLHGDAHDYYDYAYFSRIFWINCISPDITDKLFPSSLPNTRAWIDRMFNSYNGYFK